MKRYFDMHDIEMTAAIEVQKGTAAETASAAGFGKIFRSNDVREITLSQYRRLTMQYCTDKGD